MNIFCLITFKPNIIWCDFLNLFKKYKIFVIVDDNSFDLTYFTNTYKNITFIKIQNDNCKLKGYIDVNFCVNKLISGWDKALYYFGVENNNYNFIWFIEDDVFLHDESTITKIDEKYIDEDLLSNIYNENKDGSKNTWLWNRINNIQFQPPYYHGMMCAVRFSNNMMKCINDYANNYKTLFFLEALFPSIAKKNELKYTSIIELSNITWRNNFTKQDIDKSYLYHPVKDLNNHILFRT